MYVIFIGFFGIDFVAFLVRFGDEAIQWVIFKDFLSAVLFFLNEAVKIVVSIGDGFEVADFFGNFAASFVIFIGGDESYAIDFGL